MHMDQHTPEHKHISISMFNKLRSDAFQSEI